MVKPWPQAEEKLLDDKPEKEMEGLIELIRSIRNLRSTMNIAPGRQIKIFVEKSIGGKKENYIKTLAKVSAFEQSEKFPPHTAASEAGGFRFGLPLEGLVDFKKESERLRKEYDKLKAEAGKVTARLNDENFKKNATEGSAQKEQQKLEEYSARIKTLEGYLQALAA
jgi:valyl-tRNA synthetase